MIRVTNEGIEYDLLESRALWSRVRGYISIRREDTFARFSCLNHYSSPILCISRRFLGC
jgi:hypothetical protein